MTRTNEGGGLICWTYPNGVTIQRRKEDKPFGDHSPAHRLYFVHSHDGIISYGSFETLKVARKVAKCQ